MMMQLDAPTFAGLRGKRENPLGLYIALIKEKPDAGEAAHRAAFKKLLLSEGYEDFLAAVVDEWQRIKYSTALAAAAPPTVKAIREQAAKRKEERVREATATERAKTLIGDRLLKLTMPNGKPLRECTGAECIQFGGLYTAIGEKVGPTKKVGEVMTVQELTTLCRV